MIRPLPFADPDRLVKLWEDQSPQGYSALEPSPANYRDWKRMSKSFESMAAYRSLEVNLAADSGEPRHLIGASVNADLFPMLGAQAVLGRIFSPDDDRDGASGTLVLSYGLWKSQFGGDASVLGPRVVLDDKPYCIIGVMPPHFVFPSRDVQMWTAMRFAERDFQDRANNYIYVVAKLGRGVSKEQAQAEMGWIGAQLQRQYPKENEDVKVRVTGLRDRDISDRSRMLLKALLGAALCVLLIACTNLANLLLARALMRRKELAVRSAMGAGRERLVRQLLTESLVLAFAGGALSVLMAMSAAPLLVMLVPNSLPISAEPAFDLRLVALAALLTCLTGIGFGVIPAMRACSGAAASGLQEGSRGGVGGRRERLRGPLVVGEVMASVILLISAGLLIRALWRVESIDPGFRAGGVLTLRTSLPMPKHEKTATRRILQHRATAHSSVAGSEERGLHQFPAHRAAWRSAALHHRRPAVRAVGIPQRLCALCDAGFL